MTDRMKVVLDMSSVLYSRIERLAYADKLTTGEILGRALALYDVVLDAKERGSRVVVIASDGTIEQEITGL